MEGRGGEERGGEGRGGEGGIGERKPGYTWYENARMLLWL